MSMVDTLPQARRSSFSSHTSLPVGMIAVYLLWAWTQNRLVTLAWGRDTDQISDPGMGQS